VSHEQWLPPEQRDTRWYLWNERFTCRVPNIQTMSVDYIRYFGMPTTGDPLIDQQTANELVIRSLTVAKMMEYYQAGVTVRVCNEKDTARIYEIVMNHLAAWKSKMEVCLNTRDAPIQDLIDLDKFAGVVYKHARHHQPMGEWVDSFLARSIAGTLRVSRDNILRPPSPQVVIVNGAEEEKKLPEHTSMADTFLGRQREIRGGSKWK
jgi:hypothetical protein